MWLPSPPPAHAKLPWRPPTQGARRFGNLYVTEKRGGDDFDAEDERLVVTLAAFAAAAIESVMLATAEERARLDRDLLSRVIEARSTTSAW